MLTMLMIVYLRKADRSCGRLACALAVLSPAEPGEGWYLPRKALVFTGAKGKERVTQGRMNERKYYRKSDAVPQGRVGVSWEGP